MLQYFRPAIGVPFQVKQPSVRLKVAPEPPHDCDGLEPVMIPDAETGLVGKTRYAPGSVTDAIAVTLPLEMVAVNVAGELLVP